MPCQNPNIIHKPAHTALIQITLLPARRPKRIHEALIIDLNLDLMVLTPPITMTDLGQINLIIAMLVTQPILQSIPTPAAIPWRTEMLFGPAPGRFQTDGNAVIKAVVGVVDIEIRDAVLDDLRGHFLRLLVEGASDFEGVVRVEPVGHVLQCGFPLTVELVVFVPFDCVHVAHRVQEGAALDFLLVPGEGVVEEVV
jgi:hypothetical protein